jgi:hypothetical protein
MLEHIRQLCCAAVRWVVGYTDFFLWVAASASSDAVACLGCCCAAGWSLGVTLNDKSVQLCSAFLLVSELKVLR